MPCLNASIDPNPLHLTLLERMKRVLFINLYRGQEMELEGKQVFIPVTATRPLHIAGGPPMVQAIPEEYVLAANALLFLNTKKGDDLEFMMKAYLPIRVVALSNTECAFIGMLGLISSQLRLFKVEDPQLLVESLEHENRADRIEKLAKKLTTSLVETASSKPKSISGLVGGHHVASLATLLQWPATSNPEPYAFVLPHIMVEENISGIGERIRLDFQYLKELRDNVKRFDDLMDFQIKELSRKSVSSSADKIDRLRERLKALEGEIEYLESRAEQLSARESTQETQSRLEDIRSQLKSRKAAFDRDQEKKKHLEEQVSLETTTLSNAQDQLRNTIKGVWLEIEKIKREYGTIVATRPPSETTSANEYLLVPLLIAGLSKKGQIRIEIVPPQQTEEDNEKVSMRRDFVYPFSDSVPIANVLIQILSERANRDITLRKVLRDASRERNLFSLDGTRSMIIEGAELLMADGYAKQSEVQELKQYISQIPVQKLKYVPSSTDQREGRDVCKVVFNIVDAEGNAVEAARLEIGAIRLESKSSGRIEVALPLSNYEGVVEAKGFHRKTIDFTLSKPGDIVVPIVLSELSHEERLDQELNLLVERAERLKLIRARLGEAFEKHGDTLLQIPAYRNVLVELLSNLGLEPESWIAQAKNQRGMVKRLLRRDEREERMCRDILRIADESKEEGGIMLLSELLLRMDALGWEITSDALEELLRDMSKEGLLEGTISLDNGAKLVKFIPVSLTDDPQRIIVLASQHEGRVTIEEVVLDLGWTEERVRNALDLLVEKGVAKLQKSFSRSTQYWFPGLKRQDKKE
jgi:hypothetical protein